MDARIVFDFDGVLINSHKETMVTAYNVAASSLETSDVSLPSVFREAFSGNRSHASTAGEMACLADWCLANAKNGSERLSRDQFVELLPDIAALQQKADAFFEKRAEFFQQESKRWLELNVPYEPLWGFLLEKDKARDVILVTHKNKAAVMGIIHHYGLEISESNVYAGDKGKAKSFHLAAIKESFPSSRFYFIDDNLRNLLEIKTNCSVKLPLELMYANWGYGSENDEQEARDSGFLVASQESLIEFIEAQSIL